MILDGKVFSADRMGEQATSVTGTQIDAWYSGKAHEHGGNIQSVSGPDGFPLRVSDVGSGSAHDITTARELGLGALYWAASKLTLPTLADGGYAGVGIGVSTPIEQPTDGRRLDTDNRTATPCSADCAPSANAASPSSPAPGEPCTT